MVRLVSSSDFTRTSLVWGFTVSWRNPRGKEIRTCFLLSKMVVLLTSKFDHDIWGEVIYIKTEIEKELIPLT